MPRCAALHPGRDAVQVDDSDSFLVIGYINKGGAAPDSNHPPWMRRGTITRCNGCRWQACRTAS